MNRYNTQLQLSRKNLMALAVYAQMPYESILQLTHFEREALTEVLQEKADAMNPNKQNQSTSQSTKYL